MHFFIPIHAERPENAEFERNKKIIKEGFPTFVLVWHISANRHMQKDWCLLKNMHQSMSKIEKTQVVCCSQNIYFMLNSNRIFRCVIWGNTLEFFFLILMCAHWFTIKIKLMSWSDALTGKTLLCLINWGA